MESKTRTQAIEAVKKEDLLWVYDLMVRARELDEAEIRLRRQGAFQFQLSCSGHEAIQAVSAKLLKPGKAVSPSTTSPATAEPTLLRRRYPGRPGGP